MDKNVTSSDRAVARRKLVRERRKFKLDSTGEEFFVCPPTAESIRQSDWVYSKVFSQAMAGDILTADQMLDILKKRGILSPSYDEEVNSVRKQLGESLLLLSASKDLDDKERTAIKIAGLREELFALNQKINGPVANTCEQIAEDAKIDYLTSTMIENADESKVWANYDDYSTDPDYEKVFKSRVEVMLYLRNVDSDFLENTPEQIALREVIDSRTKQLREASEAKEEKPQESEPVVDKAPELTVVKNDELELVAEVAPSSEPASDVEPGIIPVKKKRPVKKVE